MQRGPHEDNKALFGTSRIMRRPQIRNSLRDLEGFTTALSRTFAAAVNHRPKHSFSGQPANKKRALSGNFRKIPLRTSNARTTAENDLSTQLSAGLPSYASSSRSFNRSRRAAAPAMSPCTRAQPSMSTQQRFQKKEVVQDGMLFFNMQGMKISYERKQETLKRIG